MLVQCLARCSRAMPVTPGGKEGESPRLRRSEEFRRVLGGRKVRGRRVILYVLPGEGEVRAGFVCSRRIGGAVVRNRARRRMREAWRALTSSTEGSFDVVFAAQPEIREARTQELIEDMRRMLTEAGVIQP